MEKKSTHSFDNKFSLDYIEEESSSLISDSGGIYYKPLWEEVAEEAKRRAEEETKRRALEEAKRRAEEEAKRRAEEEAKRRAEEEAKRRAEEEAKRRAEEEIQRKEQEEREALWLKLKKLKQKYGSSIYYSQLNNKLERISTISENIHKQSNFLCSKNNAEGFFVRKIERYIEEDILDRSYANLYVSKFLERVFGNLELKPNRFREIEKIVDQSKKLKSKISVYLYFESNEDKYLYKVLSMGDDKSSHFCDTCWQVKHDIMDVTYKDIGDCQWKEINPTHTICDIRKIRHISEKIDEKVASVRNDIAKVNRVVNELECLLKEIDSQLPCYKINLNYNRIGFLFLCLLGMSVLFYVLLLLLFPNI